MTYLLYLRPFRGSLISAVYFRREWELNPKQTKKFHTCTKGNMI